MKEYGLRKTEIYYLQANSEEEARAKLDQMDNSYAWSVEVDVCFTGAELEEASK